jgi:hypothetical protein
MTDESKSIIDPKYRGKRDKDWLAEFIDGQVKVAVMKTVKTKDDEGNVTGEEQVPSAKSVVDLDKLFALSRANHIDAKIVDSMIEQRDRPNAPGRIRMTLGNSLRAAARKRHGLYDIGGAWNEAPEAFVGESPRVEARDGSKMARTAPATDALEGAE